MTNLGQPLLCRPLSCVPSGFLYSQWKIQHFIAGSVADSPGGKPGDPNLEHTHTVLAYTHSNFFFLIVVFPMLN